MSHKGSQVPGPVNGRTLYVGIHPEAFAPGAIPEGMTAAELTARIESGWAASVAQGIEGELCLIGVGPDAAEAAIRERFAAGAFGVVLVGAGIRMLPEHTVLFERIVNTVADLGPGVRLSFNTAPEDSVDAVRRWLER